MNTKDKVIYVRIGREQQQQFLHITKIERFFHPHGTMLFYPEVAIQYAVYATEEEMLIYKLVFPNIKIKVVEDVEKLEKYYANSTDHLKLVAFGA